MVDVSERTRSGKRCWMVDVSERTRSGKRCWMMDDSAEMKNGEIGDKRKDGSFTLLRMTFHVTFEPSSFPAFNFSFLTFNL